MEKTKQTFWPTQCNVYYIIVINSVARIFYTVCVCVYLASLCFREEAFSRMLLAYAAMPGDSTCDKPFI